MRWLKLVICNLHDRLAKMYRNQGNYPSAHEHYIQASEFALATGDDDGMADRFRELVDSMKGLEFGMEEVVMQMAGEPSCTNLERRDKFKKKNSVKGGC